MAVVVRVDVSKITNTQKKDTMLFARDSAQKKSSANGKQSAQKVMRQWKNMANLLVFPLAALN